MSVVEFGMCENKAIGLKGKVVNRFEEALKQCVDWAYRCDDGFVVVYGGFKDNKLDKDLVFVDYVVERSDIYQEGHTVVPMYVMSCRVGRLVGLCWGEVEDILKGEYEEAIISFGAIYQDTDVLQVLKGEKL